MPARRQLTLYWTSISKHFGEALELEPGTDGKRSSQLSDPKSQVKYLEDIYQMLVSYYPPLAGFQYLYL